MSSGIRTAVIGPDDGGIAVALLERALPNTWSERALLAELTRADAEVWMAWRGPIATGLAVVRRVLDEGELLLIGVLPEVRRQGIARALLDALLASLDRAGALRLHLEVRATNTAAIALYRAAGFTERGRRKDYYSNPTEDAVLMTRDVSG